MYSVGYREAVLEYLDNGHSYREACKEIVQPYAIGLNEKGNLIVLRRIIKVESL